MHSLDSLESDLGRNRKDHGMVMVVDSFWDVVVLGSWGMSRWIIIRATADVV